MTYWGNMAHLDITFTCAHRKSENHVICYSLGPREAVSVFSKLNLA